MNSILSYTFLPAGYAWLANTVKCGFPPSLFNSLNKLAADPFNQTHVAPLVHEFSSFQCTFPDPISTLQTHQLEVILAGMIGLTTSITDLALKRMPGSDKLNSSFRVMGSLSLGTVIALGGFCGLYGLDPREFPIEDVFRIAKNVGFTAIGVRAVTAVAIGGLQATRLSSKLITKVIEKTCDVGIAALNGCNLIHFSKEHEEPKKTNATNNNPTTRRDAPSFREVAAHSQGLTGSSSGSEASALEPDVDDFFA